jgi:hypothetical protein
LAEDKNINRGFKSLEQVTELNMGEKNKGAVVDHRLIPISAIYSTVQYGDAYKTDKLIVRQFNYIMCKVTTELRTVANSIF